MPFHFTFAPVMLTTHNLTFSYSPTRSFTFPDVQCPNGDALLILGQSGTGKTTFLHLLALLLTPKSGSVTINDTELTTLSPAQTAAFRAGNVGIVYQKPHFVSSLSVIDNLLLANYLANKTEAKVRAKALAAQLGFADQLDKRPNQMSQGEQQRVSIARAMMNQPAVILADEPTSSLDDENANRVIALLREQAGKIGASLIVVTHDQRLKDAFTNRVNL